MKRVSIILNNGVVSPAKLMVNFSSFIQLSKGTKTLESNLHSSGLLLIILNYFDIVVVEGKEDIINYISNIALLSLISLLCILNILIYYIVIYIINNNKFIKYCENNSKFTVNVLNRIIKKYSKTTRFFMAFEIILLITCISIMFLSSVIIIKQMV